MSDTNTWSESLSRTEIEGLYDISISDNEWFAIKEKLDGMIADIFYDIRATYDLG